MARQTPTGQSPPLRDHSSLDGERNFSLLVANITDYAIYMLDPNGIVTNWNLGAQRFKGYTPEEIIGQNFERFLTEEDRSAGVPAQIWRRRQEKDDMRQRLGASARTARGFGRAWCLMRSVTKAAIS
jgi:PAS domain S-box-containing protein